MRLINLNKEERGYALTLHVSLEEIGNLEIGMGMAAGTFESHQAGGSTSDFTKNAIAKYRRFQDFFRNIIEVLC